MHKLLIEWLKYPPPCFYQETEFSLYDFQEKHTGSGYQMWDFIILWTFVFRDTEWCWLKWRELTLSKPPYLLWMFMLANLTLFWLLQISLPTITMFLSLPVTLKKCSQLPLLSCITKIPEDQHQDQMHLPVEKGTTSSGQWTRLAPSGILLDPHQKIDNLDWNDGKEINCLVLLKNTTIYSFISKMNLDTLHFTVFSGQISLQVVQDQILKAPTTMVLSILPEQSS